MQNQQNLQRSNQTFGQQGQQQGLGQGMNQPLGQQGMGQQGMGMAQQGGFGQQQSFSQQGSLGQTCLPQQGGFGQQQGLSSQTSGMMGQGSLLNRNIQPTNVTQVQLPARIIEQAPVIHEEIRQERVEEIQPVVNIEKLKTEVHQVTQPLLDKEIRAINVEQRVLPTQVLPEVTTMGGMAAPRDHSTVMYGQAQQMTVEKPAIYAEVDKTQIIEEIQPVIYKETVVPTLIKETQPIFQKYVEGPVYIQETMAPRDISGTHTLMQNVQPVVQMRTVQQPVQQMQMPQKPHPKIIEKTVTKTTTTTNTPPNAQYRM